MFCTVSERCIFVPSQWGTKSLSLTFKKKFSAGGMTCPIRSKQLSLFSHLQEMAKDASLPTALEYLTLALPILFLFYLLVLFVFIIKPWPSNTNTLFYLLVFFLFLIKIIKYKCNVNVNSPSWELELHPLGVATGNALSLKIHMKKHHLLAGDSPWRHYRRATI